MSGFGLSSDQHCHAWSQFASIDAATGLNSRLLSILKELERSCDELLSRGYKDMLFAGDLFHSRGQIDPEVFNPVHSCIKRQLEKGIVFHAIPGNHDLKGKNTTELGNAIQTLDALDGFNVITTPTFLSSLNVFMVPWIENVDELRKVLIDTFDGDKAQRAAVDLVIHAGVNGVLENMPDHGLSPAALTELGFKRVFSGHYHNHRKMQDGKVYSIGATTHQSWRDIGSKAGFLIVDDEVHYFGTHAPLFIEITAETDPVEIPLLVDGNYVRVRDIQLTDVEVNEFRNELQNMGALGASFQIVRKKELVGRTARSKGISIEASVSEYIEKSKIENIKEVQAVCQSILDTVRSEVVEA
jgi:DNA repair exonuclease SbcCD nuclease subunit